MKLPAPDPDKLSDLRRILPVIGVALFMPPLLSLFGRPVTVLGLPLSFVYIFSVWLAGIAVSAWLAVKSVGRRPPGRPSPTDRER